MNRAKYTTMRHILIFVLCLGGLAAFPVQVSAQYHTSTVGAENIGENSVTLRGYVNAFFSNTTKRWFQWGDSPESFSHETNHMFVSGGTEEFRENISGLSPRTTYFFRTVAQNTGEGAIFGEVKSFTTENGTAGTIAVSTNSVSAVGGFSATVNCFVDPQGNGDTQRWVDWGRNTRVQSSTEKKYQNVTGSYSVVLSNLSQNTVYYFRCAAKTADTNPTYGNILNFTTNTNTNTATPTTTFTGNNQSAPNFNTGANSNSFVSHVVVTKLATNIIDTGATLNAVALPVGSSQTYGWFEWGSTPNLGYTSVRRYLGAGGSLPFSEALSGLTPGTTYFFKPIIETPNGVSEGTLFSFHTTGMTTAGSTVINTQNNTNKTTPVAQKSAQSQAAGAAMFSVAKTLKVEVIPNTGTASPGERIGITVQLENTTDETLKKAAVRIIVPCEAEYVSDGGDVFLQNGQMLVHKIGDIQPKEKISFLFWMDIRANATDNVPVETIAVAEWEDKTHANGTQSVGRGIITVDKNKVIKKNAAAALATKEAGSILPKNLKGWGEFIGFLFLLLAAALVFMTVRRKKEEETFAEATASFEDVPIRPTLSRAGVPQRNYIKDPFITEKNLQKNEIAIPAALPKNNTTEKGVPPENLPI